MKKLLILITCLSLLLLISCEDTEQDIVESDIEQYLMVLINGDGSLGLDGLDDGDAIDGEYEDGLEQQGLFKVLGDTLDPGSDLRIRFGRRITNIDRDIVFTDLEDDTAIGVITRTITGDFIIFARDTATGDTTHWVKPFVTDFTRKVRFVLTDTTTNDSTGGWRINAISIGVGVTGSKVDISKLEFFTPDGTEPIYSYESDVTDLYIPRDEIPTFLAWHAVRTEVSVTNIGPEFPFNSGEAVMLHYGHGRGYKGRRLINDMGVFPDTAPDNIFTGLWRVHGPGRHPQNNQSYQRRVFRGFVDVVDLGTLYAEDEAVHSVFWALPYRSIRPVR